MPIKLKTYITLKEQYERLVNNALTTSYKNISKKTRPDQQPGKKHTKEQESNKLNVCKWGAEF